MDDLDARVGEVLENTTAEKTKYIYLRALARFVEWLYENTTECRRGVLFTSAFCELQAVSGATITEWLAAVPLRRPINLSSLSTQDCMRYLTFMEQRGVKGKSSFGNVRSAIVYLYTTTECARPHDFDHQMRRFFKGLHHTVARFAQNSNTSLCEGKEPFSFSMYRALAKAMLQSTRKQDVFGHAFLLASWNLMCRAKSTESIHYGHLSWREDSMTIIFAHMKNDQEGSRPRDPRHVYANPIMPEVCPVLGFAVYFAVLGFSNDAKLFSGGNQYSRFLKVLKSVLEGDFMQNVLEEVGLTSAAFGTHSARKGSATYVSSCSTSGPSAASICLRAGWTLPGVQDKYIRFEAAGDMVVGRYVAGLPFDSPKFAILPPFFATHSGDDDDKIELRKCIQFALDAVFPGAPPNLKMICQFGLASLLYHKTFLQQTLPSTHLLFSTPLFSANNEAQFEWLSQRIECRNCQGDDYIAPTGIPPHVGLMVELASYKAELAAMRENLTAAFEATLKRHINGSVMTMEALETAFAAVLARSNFSLHTQQGNDPVHVPESHTTRAATVQGELYTWDGSFHRVPKEFQLPAGTVRVVWQLWCAGRPPLRLLTKHDMSSRLKKIRLSELRRMMLLIQELLTNDEVQRAYSSSDAAGLLYEQVKVRLPFSPTSNKGRGRRLGQLSWRTLARELNAKTC